MTAAGCIGAGSTHVLPMHSRPSSCFDIPSILEAIPKRGVASAFASPLPDEPKSDETVIILGHLTVERSASPLTHCLFPFVVTNLLFEIRGDLLDLVRHQMLDADELRALRPEHSAARQLSPAWMRYRASAKFRIRNTMRNMTMVVPVLIASWQVSE